ncbi:hypothetical protein AOQ84DRAFT_346335 [Glonium stellatum]|uniref:Rhodopsin domain-containing protein n=1 Tax=Glonium stellatum TaxID=574774 RepID=A0A8E2ET53_9PEZI|nr:hypothetical protein AOQ84DRAFT_346335 [Glonium stellatum]
MAASSTQQAASSENIGNQLQNAAIAFIVLDTLFVSLRYVARYISGVRVGVDDFIIPLALIFNIGLCGVSLAMVYNGGIGHHLLWIASNDPAALTTFAKLQIPFTIVYALAVTFPKMAILGLYLRIFVEKSYRFASFGLIAILTSSCLAVVIVTCTQCTPISFLWDPTGHPEGHCIDIDSFWRWGSFPNVITDLIMLLLPLPCIWKLQLSKKDKIGLAVTFATGSIGLITSIIRFTTFFETNGQADSTWTAVRLGSISIAEAGVYLIAACLPTYRSLFRSVRNRNGLSTAKGSRGTRQDTTPQLVSVQSKHSKVFGSGSLSGFSRLDNDESNYKDANLVESGSYELGKRIQVQRDFGITSSHNAD